MALTATFDALLCRVRLAASGLNVAATTCTVDRTTDGIRYAVVRGGTAHTVSSGTASLDDYEFPAGVATTYRLRSYDAGGVLLDTVTATITQDVDTAWLKVPRAPFLNLPVDVSVRLDKGREARGGLFTVVNRSFPVAVGDLRGSQSFTLNIRTQTAAEEKALDYTLSTGDVVFLQAPSSEDQFPTGYFSVGSVSWGPERRYSKRRIWALDMVEVAEPGPDIIGSAYTNASVLFDYATVSAVIAANATISDLLNRTATPAEVIVP